MLYSLYENEAKKIFLPKGKLVLEASFCATLAIKNFLNGSRRIGFS